MVPLVVPIATVNLLGLSLQISHPSTSGGSVAQRILDLLNSQTQTTRVKSLNFPREDPSPLRLLAKRRGLLTESLQPSQALNGTHVQQHQYRVYKVTTLILTIVNASEIFGCALGIYDGTDWRGATMDNIAIFSVQHQCVQQKLTSFDIPAKMPPCTGPYCICAWFWLTRSGIENFYMTGFYCNITGGSTAYKIAPPQNPVQFFDNPATCVTGSKKPLYAYEYPTNVHMKPGHESFGDWRPGYHAGWSFGLQGAQNDIFVPVNRPRDRNVVNLET